MPNQETSRRQPGRITNWIVTTSLLKVCTAAILLSLAVLALAWVVWGRLGLSQCESASTRSTAALTTVGGLGGSVYLVVRYRAQNLAEKQHMATERDHVEQLMDKVVDLLVSNNSLKRVSGARQLILLADECNDIAHQQRVIDTFCTFFRLSTSKQLAVDVRDGIAFVEEIFFTAMKNHLQNSDEPHSAISWSECVFDFKNIHFNSRIDLSGCRFKNTSDWRRAHFSRGAVFSGSIFDGASLFSGVHFEGETKFDGCEFATDTDFSYSQFKDEVRFTDTHFKEAVSFGHVRDENEDPSNIDALPATFYSEADFSGAVFGGDARFGLGDTARSLVSRFEKEAHFEGSRVERKAYFGDVLFMNGAFFNKRRGANTPGEESAEQMRPDAEGASFSDIAYFRHAYFHTNGKYCLKLDFAKLHEADFQDCEFDDRDVDSGDTLPSIIDFTRSLCASTPDFEGAVISCRRHRSPSSYPVWPEGTSFEKDEEGEEKGIPEGSYCPSCSYDED